MNSKLFPSFYPPAHLFNTHNKKTFTSVHTHTHSTPLNQASIKEKEREKVETKDSRNKLKHHQKQRWLI